MRFGKRSLILAALLSLLLLVLAGCGSSSPSTGTSAGQSGGSTGNNASAQPITLNMAIAGDTNMVDLYKAIDPEFQKKYPNITLNPVGTGPGDPGSQAIFTKLNAEAKAGSEKWDLDVAVVHQSIMGDMIKNNLVDKYVSKLENAKYVVGDAAKNSLGTDVTGYVVPMFQSQIAIAYTPSVTNPPTTYEELEAWIKAHPGKFGYNGITNGMSGVGFVTGWVYWKTQSYDKLAKGPYSDTEASKWSAAIKELKALPTTITNGNNGTLDMLNREEIQMGPVWVDMYFTWIRENRLNPNIKIKLISPGLPGQPEYLVIPARAANKDAALKFIDFMASPDVQAKFIVERNGWYPGIDPSAVMPKVPADVQQKLFSSVTKDDLDKKGLAFPLAPYLKDVQRAYETN